jgi:hypothetical protein
MKGKRRSEGESERGRERRNREGSDEGEGEGRDGEEEGEGVETFGLEKFHEYALSCWPEFPDSGDSLEFQTENQSLQR